MKQKNFFLISFLPALAYWYLEENYPIKVAVIGGVSLAVLEISIEYFFTKHVHTISKFNFFLIGFLGGLSLLGDEGLWFKLQPAFTGVCIGLFMVYRLWQGEGLMWETMQSMPQKPLIPKFLVRMMEKHMVFLFGGYGIFMAYVALSWSTDRWVFFKTIGFYIVFAVFAILEVFYLRRRLASLLRDKSQEFSHGERQG